MRNKIKKQVPDRNKPLVEKEELENLIKEMMTDKEVEDLLKEGFTENKLHMWPMKRRNDEQGRVIGKIIDILTWIFPDFK
ncbi:MAG: hypothetical protein ACLRL6_15015 [Clostridium sp.]